MTTTDDDDDDDDDEKAVEEKEVGDVAHASRASSEVDGGTADVDALTKEVVKLKVETTAASPPETFEHVVELSGIARDVKTRELERCVSGTSTSTLSPNIVWVGKTRACVVWPTTEEAEACVKAGPYKVRDHPEIKCVRWIDACDEVRATSPSELRAPRERPKTNASVARRMIGNALNINLSKAPGRGGEEDRKALAEERKKRAEERARARDVS
jgi:hypothetical protein